MEVKMKSWRSAVGGRRFVVDSRQLTVDSRVRHGFSEGGMGDVRSIWEGEGVRGWMLKVRI